MKNAEEIKRLALNYLEEMQAEVDVFRNVLGEENKKLSDKDRHLLIGAASLLESIADECRLMIQEIAIK